LSSKSEIDSIFENEVTMSSTNTQNVLNPEYDYMFKLLILGESGVGKSAMLLRFSDDSFNDTFVTTIGVDFKFKTIHLTSKDGYTKTKVVKLQIWDTAGQEKFRNITTTYYRKAHGVILVFDVTNRNSFTRIQDWMEDIKRHSEEATPVILLVGNKTDLTSSRVVTTEEAKELADSMKLQYLETSAKSGNGVQNAFVQLTKKILEIKYELVAKDSSTDSKEEEVIKGEDLTRKNQQPQPKGRKCGC